MAEAVVLDALSCPCCGLDFPDSVRGRRQRTAHVNRCETFEPSPLGLAQHHPLRPLLLNDSVLCRFHGHDSFAVARVAADRANATKLRRRGLKRPLPAASAPTAQQQPPPSPLGAIVPTKHAAMPARALDRVPSGPALYGNERTFVFYAQNLEGVRRVTPAPAHHAPPVATLALYHIAAPRGDAAPRMSLPPDRPRLRESLSSGAHFAGARTGHHRTRAGDDQRGRAASPLGATEGHHAHVHLPSCPARTRAFPCPARTRAFAPPPPLPPAGRPPDSATVAPGAPQAGARTE